MPRGDGSLKTHGQVNMSGISVTSGDQICSIDWGQKKI